MDGFELQSLLWILSVNQFKFDESELQEVIQLRADVLLSADEDRAKRLFVDNALTPRRIKFSKVTIAHTHKLLRRMIAMHPHVFSEKAVTERTWNWVITFCAHFTIAYFISDVFGAFPDIVPTAQFTFVILGILSMIPAIHLFRMSALTKRLIPKKE